jgi:hypothetical protein
MPYDDRPRSSARPVAEMEAALHYLARMMKAQPNAKKLVPVFNALKEQIDAARRTDHILAMAIAMAGD